MNLTRGSKRRLFKICFIRLYQEDYCNDFYWQRVSEVILKSEALHVVVRTAATAFISFRTSPSSVGLDQCCGHRFCSVNHFGPDCHSGADKAVWGGTPTGHIRRVVPSRAMMPRDSQLSRGILNAADPVCNEHLPAMQLTTNPLQGSHRITPGMNSTDRKT